MDLAYALHKRTTKGAFSSFKESQKLIYAFCHSNTKALKIYDE